MRETIADLVTRMRQLEDRLNEEFQKSRDDFHVRVKGRVASFSEEVLAAQRASRLRLLEFLKRANFAHILVAPIIYSVAIPLVFLDVSLTLYQHICFRAYGIPRVKRSTFIFIDRHHLAYLNALEKFNCLYCSYGNGVLAYAREIASRTEQFWCPIKHAIRVRDPHKRYYNFVEYGDGQGYRHKLDLLRKDVQNSEE